MRLGFSFSLSLPHLAAAVGPDAPVFDTPAYDFGVSNAMSVNISSSPSGAGSIWYLRYISGVLFDSWDSPPPGIGTGAGVVFTADDPLNLPPGNGFLITAKSYITSGVLGSLSAPLSFYWSIQDPPETYLTPGYDADARTLNFQGFNFPDGAVSVHSDLISELIDTVSYDSELDVTAFSFDIVYDDTDYTLTSYGVDVNDHNGPDDGGVVVSVGFFMVLQTPALSVFDSTNVDNPTISVVFDVFNYARVLHIIAKDGDDNVLSNGSAVATDVGGDPWTGDVGGSGVTLDSDLTFFGDVYYYGYGTNDDSTGPLSPGLLYTHLPASPQASLDVNTDAAPIAACTATTDSDPSSGGLVFVFGCVAAGRVITSTGAATADVDFTACVTGTYTITLDYTDQFGQPGVQQTFPVAWDSDEQTLTPA